MPYRHWCAAVAVGIVIRVTALGAQEEPPNTPIQPSSGQEQTAKQPTVESDTGEAPIPPTQPPAKEHDAPAAEDTSGDARNYLYWGDGIAQWAMAFTGVAAFFLSGWAVWLVNRTLRSSQDAVLQATRAANAAIDAVKEARIANKFAEEANNETRRIGNAQIRSYVFVRATNGPSRDALKGGPATRFEILNKGLGPANIDLIEAMGFVANYPLPDDHGLPDEWIVLGSKGVIYPSDTPSDFTIKAPPVTNEETRQRVLSSQTHRLYYAVRVAYADGIGPHREQLCVSFSYREGPHGRFEGANKHNISE